MLHTGSPLQFPFGAANSFSPSATDSKWNVDSLFPPSPLRASGGGSPLFQDVNWSAMQPPPEWLAPSGGVHTSLDGSCIESGEGLSSSMKGFEDALLGMQAHHESELGPGLKMFGAEGITSSSVTLDVMDTMMPGVEAGHQQQEVMFEQLVEETQALVERINNFPKAGALRTAPSLGALLGMGGTSGCDDVRNSSLPLLATGFSATARTLDDLLASEPDMSDMFDWPPSLSNWKGQGEEMMDVDGSRTNLSSPAETYNRSAGASNRQPGVDTLHSLGATSDIDDLDLADEDMDANDNTYLPSDEKRKRTNALVKRQGNDKTSSPPSSSAADAMENKRSKQRNLFQSPPINEVVKLLGLSGRWRKYGRKVMKNCPYPAHYYKCAVPGCDAKRKVWYDENEVLQMQGKGDDHTHPTLTKSEVLGHHRVCRRSSASPTSAPDDSHSPSSSASDGGTESFYSEGGDSESGGAKSSGGHNSNSKSCGDAQKQKRVAWPRLPNPSWHFRRCTPDDQTAKPGNNNTNNNNNNVKSHGQSSDAPLQLEARREVNNHEGEDRGRERMIEWPLDSGFGDRQLALGGGGGENPLANFDLSWGIRSSGRGSESRVDSSLADSRPGGELGLGGLYEADDQMLIFTPVFGRQHSWCRLRRQFSSDLMQSFDATGL